MIQKNELVRVKDLLQDNIGHKVKLTSKKGRKNSVVRHGVIEETFSSVFIIKLDNAIEDLSSSSRRVSYSYTDILTNSIEVAIG